MSLLQTVRNAVDTSTADGLKAQAQLDFLTNAAQARLALYEGQLKLSLTDGGGDTPIKIVGDPIAYLQDYRCNVSSDPASGITDAVNLFFGGSGADIKQGFQALINAGLNTILGSTAMGQTEQVQTLITMEHNAIIRVDVKAWRYNFSDTGVIATLQNAFCYVFCKSVVDHTKVSIDTLVYLISEMVGDDQGKVKAFIANLKTIYADLKSVSPEAARQDYLVAANPS
jgi:hypothetical protein